MASPVLRGSRQPRAGGRVEDGDGTRITFYFTEENDAHQRQRPTRSTKRRRATSSATALGARLPRVYIPGRDEPDSRRGLRSTCGNEDRQCRRRLSTRSAPKQTTRIPSVLGGRPRRVRRRHRANSDAPRRRSTTTAGHGAVPPGAAPRSTQRRLGGQGDPDPGQLRLAELAQLLSPSRSAGASTRTRTPRRPTRRSSVPRRSLPGPAAAAVGPFSYRHVRRPSPARRHPQNLLGRERPRLDGRRPRGPHRQPEGRDRRRDRRGRARRAPDGRAACSTSGAARGWLAHALHELGLTVHGVDGSAGLIEAARARGGGSFEVLDYETAARKPRSPPRRTLRRGRVQLRDPQRRRDADPPRRRSPARRRRPRDRADRPPRSQVGGDYADGWRQESFADLGGDFDPMPWYFRTIGSWIRTFRSAGLTVTDLREPTHTARPACPCRSSGQRRGHRGCRFVAFGLGFGVRLQPAVLPDPDRGSRRASAPPGRLDSRLRGKDGWALSGSSPFRATAETGSTSRSAGKVARACSHPFVRQPRGRRCPSSSARPCAAW